jgi:hypothetical protein
MAPAVKAHVEAEIDRVYGLPLKDFTAARDELAKRLRQEGERQLADEVKRLRKPPVAVWVVNQLARERELDVQRLLKAGESLAKAQAGTTEDTRAAFLAARRDEQHALEVLAKAARETMKREGLGTAALDRVTQTLRAASLTKEAREQLKRGRLTEELEPPGFEALASMPAPARRGKRRRPETKAKDRDDGGQAIAQARERVRALRADERALAREAATRNREAAKAEEQAVAKRKEAERAQAASDEAAVARADAEKELDRLSGR